MKTKVLILLLGSILSFAAFADWDLTASTDEMTGKKTEVAAIQSVNSLDLGFPYKGSNYGTLMVRKKGGTDVIFTIDKGQILCDSYHGCSVNVKFDNKPPQRFRAVTSSDHSRTVLFLTETSRFISEAQKAKQILVQPLLYQTGEVILKFQTNQSLKWGIKK